MIWKPRYAQGPARRAHRPAAAYTFGVCLIAQAIISMGKALGMTVVAEGVETPEQQAFLRSHACDEMQGFLFSKPVPPRQMAELLRATPALKSPPLQPEPDSGLEGAVV